MMATAKATRKQRFDAGLKATGRTASQWCDEYGVSQEHLRLVFRGERKPSAKLTAAIDAVIEAGRKAMRAA